KEGLLFVAIDEIQGEVVAEVGAIHFLVGGHGLSVLDVALAPIPAARYLVREVFIEAPILRRLADLPPLAGLASRVAILLQESGDGVLVLGFGARAALPPRLVQETAGAKGVTTRHEQAARRAAQRRRI